LKIRDQVVEAMSLQNIPLDRIGEADIQRLLSMGVGESPYLDYKQESYGDAGNDRSEFLADISSFANTLGGDLVTTLAAETSILAPQAAARPALARRRCVVNRRDVVRIDGRASRLAIP
jgi:hypothetical protein